MIIVRLVLVLAAVSLTSVVVVRRISVRSVSTAVGLFLAMAVVGLVALYYLTAVFGNWAGS